MSEIPDFVNNFDQLTTTPPRRRFVVVGPCPVNGLRFRIQSLFEGELSAYQAASVGKDGFKPAKMQDANRRLIVRCLVDKDGNRLLTDEQAGKLIGWDAADATYLYEACAKHVGLKRDDIEDLAKNSEPTVADSSPIG